MPQHTIVRTAHGFYLYSWSTGFIPAKLPESPLTEEDILALALWLTRNGKTEEAENLLERYCNGL